jgi:hypothetical protein
MPPDARRDMEQMVANMQLAYDSAVGEASAAPPADEPADS